MYGFGSRKKGKVPVTSICDPFRVLGKMFFRRHFECEGIGQRFQVLGVLVVVQERSRLIKFCSCVSINKVSRPKP